MAIFVDGHRHGARDQVVPGCRQTTFGAASFRLGKPLRVEAKAPQDTTLLTTEVIPERAGGAGPYRASVTVPAAAPGECPA